MGTGFRPVYANDSVTLQRDTLSTLTAAGLTASTYTFIGTANWTIAVPPALTGAIGLLTVQANNSNPIAPTDLGNISLSGIKNPVNPLMNQPGMGNRGYQSLNPSFTANWVNIGTLSGNPQGNALIAFSNTPVRFVRLSGLGLTAAGFVAYIWTDSMVQGN